MGDIRTIDFHGDKLLGIEAEGGAFVYLKPIVERIGLDWSAQLKRIKRDPILSEGMAMMTIPPEFGGANDAVFLKLDLFHGWLFTVDAGRVRAEARGPLLTYQREAYAVLARAFARTMAPAAEILPPAPITSPDAGLSLRLVIECRKAFGMQKSNPARAVMGCNGGSRLGSEEKSHILELSSLDDLNIRFSFATILSRQVVFTGGVRVSISS